MLYLGVLVLLFDLVAGAGDNVTLTSQCHCGFRDPSTKELYTDSIILYFNESSSVDSHIFKPMQYAHKNQRGWNTVYRQGASPDNVRIGNNGTVPWLYYADNPLAPSLEMILDPARFDHLSTGAELRSLRRDIMYGTFRTEMRSPPPWVGGSSMSMYLQFNGSESASIDLLNMNMKPMARVMQTINGEWPSYDLAVNYTTIEEGEPPKIPQRNPWDFTELRFDWTNQTMDFFVNQNLSRHVTKDDRSIPVTPQTLYFSHWSTGDSHYMQGPPVNGSIANVRWVRAFFNSSVMTGADHHIWDSKCEMKTPCSVDDMSLRGSTEYSHLATVPFKEPAINQRIRYAAAWVAASFSFIGIISIINAVIRRGPWYKLKDMDFPGSKRASTAALRRSIRDSLAWQGPVPGTPYENIMDPTAGFETPAPGYTSRPGHMSPYHNQSGSQTPLPAYQRHSPWQSMYKLVTHKRSQRSLGSDTSQKDTPGPSRSRNASTASAYPRPKGGVITLPAEGLPPPEDHPIPPYEYPDVNITNPAVVEAGEDYEICVARSQAYFDLEGRPHEDVNEEDAENENEMPLATPLSSSASSQSPRRDSFGEVHNERDLRPYSSFMDLDEKSSEGSIKGEARKERSDSKKRIEWHDIPRQLERYEAKRRTERLDSVVSKKQLRFVDAEDIPQVPEAPQDMSAFKLMTEKTGIPDGMTGGATAEPSKEQAPKPATQAGPNGQAPQKRIDYLAGLVAISCIIVTMRHFSLTFWPFVTESQGDSKHFYADRVLSYFLGPYLLGPLWIGPFFVTSCRFLAQRYLRTGKLDDIANKMLLRAPRMLIPCLVFMTLEYFLISLGLTGRLEWLPSVTYSTWPYVRPQPNFAIFINELVELSYITPNAAPEVINHYCVGVLWTIPVQLQFSFVVLMATVMIKDVKKPWKRFSFYGLAILFGWYGSSWSACHWLGLMLADMDITYDWKKWVYARWWRYWPILLLAFGLVGVTPLVLLFNSDFYNWSFMSWENAIHPDPVTGRPIYETLPTIWWAYPEYFAPTFATLVFSLGLQVIVELSTWVQKALSIKLVTFFHPHIMTIYLLHGFVFWSLGAFVAVALSDLSLPYWAILTIVAVVCYSTILLVTVILTPMIEFSTKGASKNIWRWATEEPVPHRRTTAPFDKALVVGRQTEATEMEISEPMPGPPSLKTAWMTRVESRVNALGIGA